MQPRWRRTLAECLARHAGRALPGQRAAWSEAMARETAAIPEESDALRWAAGCVLAAYRERLLISRSPGWNALRVAAVGMLVVMVVRDTFATALTLAWRTDALGLATRLGQATAGEDFRRLIPLMQATPWFIHAQWVAAAVLYACAIAATTFNTRRASLLVAAGVALDAVAEVMSRPIVAATGVEVTPGRSPIGHALPFAISLVVAFALCLNERRLRESRAVLG